MFCHNDYLLCHLVHLQFVHLQGGNLNFSGIPTRKIIWHGAKDNFQEEKIIDLMLSPYLIFLITNTSNIHLLSNLVFFTNTVFTWTKSNDSWELVNLIKMVSLFVFYIKREVVIIMIFNENLQCLLINHNYNDFCAIFPSNFNIILKLEATDYWLNPISNYLVNHLSF